VIQHIMLSSAETYGDSILKKEWTHMFIHTLDTIPKNWYLELEMRRETTELGPTNSKV
jgi:hypothetical protein